MLELLLRAEFPGVSALREQLRSLRVRGLSAGSPTVLLFEVGDPDVPRGEVVNVVPVEAKVRDAEPPQELLLFVKDGLLDSLELVVYGDDEPTDLPAVEDIAPPTVNGA